MATDAVKKINPWPFIGGIAIVAAVLFVGSYAISRGWNAGK